MGTTKTLAEWIVTTKFDDFPADAVEISKGLVLDFLGGAVSGTPERVTQIATQYVRDVGGVPECCVIGQGFRTSLPDAVLVNATSAHSQELEAMGHYAGANPFYDIPVALAMGEKFALSGKEVLEGIIIGFEIQGRLGRYLPAWGRGFSGLTLYGTMGSVATASKMLKLTVDQTRMAIGLAVGSSGSQRNAGSMAHLLESGIGCRNGVTSALLAKRGATSDPDLLDGKAGFVDQFVAGEYDLEAVTKDLGKSYYVVDPGTWVKKYGCCSLNHRALEALLLLLEEHPDIRYDDVDRVQVEVLPSVRDFLRFVEPENAEQAKFSLHQALGSAVLDGKSDLKAFTDAGARDPKYIEARRKVDVTIHDGDRFAKWAPPVTVKLKSGQEYVRRADVLKGSRDMPLTQEELIARHKTLIGKRMSSKQLQSSIDLALGLDGLDDVVELMELYTFGPKAETVSRRAVEASTNSAA